MRPIKDRCCMNEKPGASSAEARDDPRGRRLEERLRSEFVAGAEAEWRRRVGRPLTRMELLRVLRHYPGP
jgi:hypothetical protein